MLFNTEINARQWIISFIKLIIAKIDYRIIKLFKYYTYNE